MIEKKKAYMVCDWADGYGHMMDNCKACVRKDEHRMSNRLRGWL